MRERVITRCVAARFGDAECECPKHVERCECGNVMTHFGLRLCDRCAEQQWADHCSNDCGDPDSTAPAVAWVERDPRNAR